jgi:hypothetical protein
VTANTTITAIVTVKRNAVGRMIRARRLRSSFRNA